jgi:hypothetical protein
MVLRHPSKRGSMQIQVSQFTWNLFCPPAPSQIDLKNSGGGIVKQVVNIIGTDSTSYIDPYPGPNNPNCNNPRITSSTTILSDTNQQSLTTSAYGTFGNVADQYDYDWGVQWSWSSASSYKDELSS